MKLRLEKYQESFFNARGALDSKTLDHVWTLWQNLEESASDELVQTCLYFIEMFNFDIEELPESLRDAVMEEMQDDELLLYN